MPPRLSPALLGLCIALMCAACKEPPKPDTAPRAFVVDSPGAHYILDDPKQGRIGAASLESIPWRLRGVVRVRHDTWPKADPQAKGDWVVDVLDARPGDSVQATWRAQRAIVGAQIAQDRAYHTASDVHFVASEMAVVHPDSDRNKRALKLRELLPKNLKASPPAPSLVDTP